MAPITIRNLDDDLTSLLRVRAARRQRSMEEEVRHILKAALSDDACSDNNLAAAIQRRFKPLGGVDMKLSQRGITISR